MVARSTKLAVNYAFCSFLSRELEKATLAYIQVEIQRLQRITDML